MMTSEYVKTVDKGSVTQLGWRGEVSVFDQFDVCILAKLTGECS